MSLALPTLPARSWLLGMACCFAVIALAVYGRSLHNEFVRWDDGLLIYENPGVMEITPASLKHVFTTYDPELYIPLTLLSYQIDVQIAGPNPFVFHLHSFLLHLLDALLVTWFAFLLLRQKWLAVFVGLAFLLHPLHTEAIAWASGRKDVQSLFFFLLALIGYLYAQDRGDRHLLWWSIAAYLCGLLSKGQILILPVILLLLDRYRGVSWREAFLRDKMPFWVLSVVFGIIGIIGKAHVAAATGIGTKIIMSFYSTVFYLKKLVWPDHFSLLYPYTGEVSLLLPLFFVPFLLLLVLVGLCWILRRKLPELWLCLGFAYVALAPTFLNFAKGDELGVYAASDRYAYVASIGVFLLVAFLLKRALPHASSWLVSVVAVALLLPLPVLAYRQSLVWKDTASLFENVIRYFPESSFVAHNNLGNMYRLKKDLPGAIAEYRKALAIRPHPKTWTNMGAAYRSLHQYDEARSAYQQALLLDAENKEAHFGFGILEAQLGQSKRAEEEYRQALRIDSLYEEPRTNLATLLLQSGNVSDAIEEYQTVLRINPYFADAQYNLAVAYTKQGNLDAAIAAFQRAIKLNPRDPAGYINLGILLAKKGDREGSITAFQEVLKMQPNNVTARSALQQLGN